MTVDVQALGIDRLSVGERVELIDLSWDGLPEPIQPAGVPGWRLAEIERTSSGCGSIAWYRKAVA
jgi:hypothetical protein